MMDFLLNLALVLVNLALPIFKKTPLYGKLEKWITNIHLHNRLHTGKEVNKKVMRLFRLTDGEYRFRYETMVDSSQLNGALIESYEDDMHTMPLKDFKTVLPARIPYLEIINFIDNPDTEVSICCSADDPLFLNKEYTLPDNIDRATQRCLDEVTRNNPSTTNDPHPRLASLIRTGENKYQCVLQKTTYYTQIKSNLSMDYPICIDGRRSTTMRTLESEAHKREQQAWQAAHVDYDALHPRCLASLDHSLLANVIGVSAIWCMGDLSAPKFYLMPRNKKVGVYRNELGMPSGDIECPQYQNKPAAQRYRFRDASLIEFLKWEMAREFAEETGIRDISKSLDDYSIKVEETAYQTQVEIIPLALTREMLRGGKPQMFFLIRTEEIPEKVLKKCFLASLGVTEFDDRKVTTAAVSAEVACNYLYALEYLQGNMGGVINIV